MRSNIYIKNSNCLLQKGDNNETLWVIGQPFYKNKLLTPYQLLDKIRNLDSKSEFTQFLYLLNGFFSIVYRDKNKIIAVVDHVRSYPLLYSKCGNNFYVSDSGSWIKRELHEKEMDQNNKIEFIITGYVTGNETLYPNIKQLQAGECLIIDTSINNPKPLLLRYYKYVISENNSFNTETLSQELNQRALNVTKRLIDYADGKQIVIPLSGGLDSRLIAKYLHILNYKNVITFTYGAIHNVEVEMSKFIADRFKYRWYYINYNAKTLAKTWNTSDAKKYRECSSNLSSLPHVQDFYAIKELLSLRVIDENSVIVPGHTGDFLTGGHMPRLAFTKLNFTDLDVKEAIYDRHYINGPQRHIKAVKNHIIRDRIDKVIKISGVDTRYDFLYATELWNWQERQSKYIVNSVRVYDHFGLRWWLPLWDREFVEFWRNLPIELKLERNFYIKYFLEYLDEIYEFDNVEIHNIESGTTLSSKSHSPIVAMMPNISKRYLRKMYKSILYYFGSDDFTQHPYAYEGFISKRDLSKYFLNSYNLLGAYADLFVNNKWDEIDGW